MSTYNSFSMNLLFFSKIHNVALLSHRKDVSRLETVSVSGYELFIRNHPHVMLRIHPRESLKMEKT